MSKNKEITSRIMHLRKDVDELIKQFDNAGSACIRDQLFSIVAPLGDLCINDDKACTELRKLLNAMHASEIGLREASSAMLMIESYLRHKDLDGIE